MLRNYKVKPEYLLILPDTGKNKHLHGKIAKIIVDPSVPIGETFIAPVEDLDLQPKPVFEQQYQNRRPTAEEGGLQFNPRSDPNEVASVHPHFITLKRSCPKCGSRMIENKRGVECGGQIGKFCNYMEREESPTREQLDWESKQ